MVTNVKSVHGNITRRLNKLFFCCNILIRPHFPVHMRGLHKWNTHLYMSLNLCSTSFSIYCTICGSYRNGGGGGEAFTFADVGGGISCK